MGVNCVSRAATAVAVTQLESSGGVSSGAGEKEKEGRRKWARGALSSTCCECVRDFYLPAS